MTHTDFIWCLMEKQILSILSLIVPGTGFSPFAESSFCVCERFFAAKQRRTVEKSVFQTLKSVNKVYKERIYCFWATKLTFSQSLTAQTALFISRSQSLAANNWCFANSDHRFSSAGDWKISCNICMLFCDRISASTRSPWPEPAVMSQTVETNRFVFPLKHVRSVNAFKMLQKRYHYSVSQWKMVQIVVVDRHIFRE